MPRKFLSQSNALILSIVLLAVGLLLASFWQGNDRHKEHYIDQLELYLSENREAAIDWWENISPAELIVDSLDPPRTGISLLFQRDSLIYWNSNRILPSPTQIASFDSLNRVLLLKNGWYQTLKFQKGELIAVFLFPLKTQYPFTNAYLRNRFPPSIDIPDDVQLIELIDQEVEIDAVIYDSGRPVIGFQVGAVKTVPESLKWSVACISLSIFFFLVWWWSWPAKKFHNRSWRALMVFAIGVLALRGVLYLFGFPSEVLPSPIWSPSLFAIPYLASSLGELFLHVSAFCLIVIYAFRILSVKKVEGKFSTWSASLSIALLISAGAWLSRQLVLNSTMELDLSNFAVLDRFSLFALVVLAMYWAAAGLTIHLFVRFHFQSQSYRSALLHLLFQSVLVSVFLFLLDFSILALFVALVWLCFFLWINGIVGLSDRWRWTYGGVVAWLITLSLLPAIALFEGNTKKQLIQQQACAQELIEQRDWYLELSLQSLAQDISEDPYSQAIFTNPYIQPKDLRKRFLNLYFGGEFSRFDVDVHAFNPSGFEMKRSEEVYLDEFQNLINRFGEPTPSDFFFYMNQPEVTQMYIGLIPVNSEQKFLGNLIVECKPKVYQSNNVYPELLLEGTRMKSSWESRFKFAIWKQGVLSRAEGDIPRVWNQIADTTELYSDQFRVIRMEGYQGVFLMTPGQQLILVFDEVLKPKVVLSYFSYFVCLLLLLFALFYAFELITALLKSEMGLRELVQIGLRARINIALVSVILISFLIIGAVTVSYFVEEFETYHKERLFRKQTAIQSDIRANLLEEGADSLILLKGSAEELEQEVEELSVIHSMDINLYDLTGQLLVSSQPTIFEEGLISNRMKFSALQDLRKGLDQVISEEAIGGLNYVSVYTPVKTTTGQPLAYLHLPYFARERNLDRDISSFMVTLINAYVLLLILTGFLAILISRGVNRSLRLIAEKLGKVQISGQNEPIPVKTKDEIGLLVEEYNMMIRELEHSAKKLAETERESAWREMAKQIAHEIKNPLTPMKLSIQHLLRAMKSGDPDAPELAERVSKTLIEQIDNLSSIASAFSAFAKMPKANSELLDLKALVTGVIELFQNEEDSAALSLDAPNQDVFVYADKNQLISVFNNLIKNAIQAVPEDRNPVVEVQIKGKETHWVLSVKDNGSGIAEDFHSKVFVPNFTTKGSGSGLGLAIARRIIDQAGGEIWFDTNVDTGTTFFVQLPNAENRDY